MPFDKDGTLYLDGDENADWIKRVNNGASQREELEAHRELTLMYAQRKIDAGIARESNCGIRHCKHYTGLDRPTGKESTEVHICTAFPTGIPDDIAYGSNLHILPVPNDRGIQYESEI